jgi:transcription antitermination factor NusG
MNTGKHWYAIYTRPRWEKKVHMLLHDRGFESYCPLQKAKRQWSDRVKLVEEPLFKSYVFVCLSETEKTEVRFVNGVVNFIYWLGKPAVIKASDIEKIKRFLNEHEHIEIENLPLAAHSRVIITSGVLMDKEATVIKDNRNKVMVEIESLGCRLVAWVERERVILV